MFFFPLFGAPAKGTFGFFVAVAVVLFLCAGDAEVAPGAEAEVVAGGQITGTDAEVAVGIDAEAVACGEG